jgi:hypothetical protein
MPYKNGNIVWNETTWTPGMINFLKKNYWSMTNMQLANALDLRLTVLRNKTRYLGLKKLEPEYWNEKMIFFLKTSYRIMGDVEIVDFFTDAFPKKKGWKKGAIRKKRVQLQLIRTDKQIRKIVTRHHSIGGRSYTIHKNSASNSMHDSWVALMIARKNPELQLELKKHPDIINAARNLILLKRKIRQHENQPK